MRVFLDMDGVLVDFVQGALAAHGRQLSELKPGEWDIHTSLGIEAAAFYRRIKGEPFWANLGWMADGRDILALLERRFGQANICLLSSPVADHWCASGKVKWVNSQLPAYSRQYLIGPCKDFCAGPDKLLIDDRESNVEAFQKEGGQAILVPRFWNSAHAQADKAVSVVESLLPIERITCPMI